MALPSESRAFPSHLHSDVAPLAAQLSAGQLHPASDSFAVYVNGEELNIPKRVYYQEPLLLKGIQLSGQTGLVASCLGTRHHNGFVREKCLAQLLRADDLWVAPYVIQLIGEYVLPIVEIIEASIPQFAAQIYCTYIGENPAHYKITQSRAASYWDTYHRIAHPRWHSYPGYRAFVALNELCRTTPIHQTRTPRP
jgi:hypothetical protein